MHGYTRLCMGVIFFFYYNAWVMSTALHERMHGFAHPHKNTALFGLESGMKVADFGAGSGAYVVPMAEAVGESGRVYAIDVQKDLLKRIANEAIHKQLNTIDIIWADLEVPRASKLAQGSIDLVLMSNILFQVHHKSFLLKEAHRIVKKNGRAIIIDWSDSFGGMGPVKDDVVKKDAAITLAQKAGFELVSEFEAGAHHYGLVLAPVSV